MKIFDYIIERSKNDPDFYSSILKRYNNNAKYSSLIFRILLAVLFLFYKPRKKVTFFFYGTRFCSLIKSLPSEEVCIIGGPKQIPFIVQNNASILSNMDFWYALYKALLSRIFKLSNMEKLEKKFIYRVKPYITENSIFIVDNDSLPMQRFLIGIFKSLSVKTICIQNGIFQSRSNLDFIHGGYADKFICYDNYQKKIMLKKGVSENKLIVGGFYEQINIPHRGLSVPENRKICFLGQPWFRYSAELSQIQYKNYLKIKEFADSKKLQLFYKSHPWEIGAPYLDEMENRVDMPMQEAIELYDVFISHTSTALFETNFARRIAIQIYDESFECDDFFEIGYCYSLRVDKHFCANLFELVAGLPMKTELTNFNMDIIITNETKN